MVFLDRVYAAISDGSLEFRALPRLSTTDVADIRHVARARILGYLERRGVIVIVIDRDTDVLRVDDDLAERDPALAPKGKSQMSSLAHAEPLPSSSSARATADAGLQAYKILLFAFTVAPILAGADKFFHLLTNWDQYVAPVLARMLGGATHAFMLVVGVVEIAAGVIVATRPKIGAYVVAAWLSGIIVDLLLCGRFFDIALRDLGLALGALALAKLAPAYAD